MLLIYKEKGLSSFAVIEKLRKLLGIKKIGHAGTLDPLAEGLLIVLVGRDETKKQQDFMKLDKEYEAVARLGIKTDTGDLEGKIVERRNCSIDKKEAEKALTGLLGCYIWELPLYSAKKVKGKPLYKYAREGKSVEVPKKEMCIKSIELLDVKCSDGFCDIKYKVTVSSGTFIRTLSEKIGEALSCPATTVFLKRTKIGKFSVENAKKLDEIKLDD